MDDKRIVHLEQTVAALLAKGVEDDRKLNQVIAIITRLSQNVNQNVNQNVPTEHGYHARKRTVRPALPSEFNGDRTKGMSFLNSCQTYIRLCPDEFRDEQTKVVWANVVYEI